MTKLRRIVPLALVAASLVVSGGVALAAVEDEDADTLFNFGYDADNHVLIFDSSATDSPFDCTLENGALTVGYSEAEWPLIESLRFEGSDFMFSARPAEEVGEEYTPATDPVPYSSEEGAPCALDAGEVAGPNGQINHGQFMRLFNHLYKGGNRGCLARWLAQSDLGKGEQQLRTPDVDPGFTPAMSGEVDFTTAPTNCDHGRGNDSGDEDATAAGGGHRGKSSSAPGQLKKQQG
jgi:hypothetical protein